MPILNFKEIPLPTSGASRDQFELFAREFLDFVGFQVVVGPDRGPDAGRDLIVEEIRTGIAGETRVRWLVSCKHKAHSGASVTPDDESDIHDRVRTHDCKGFLGIYSTLPSSGLAAKLNASGLPFEVQVYDHEKIEKQLLSSKGALLAQRFFPSSWLRWKKEHPTPAKIFREEPELLCAYCKRSLLTPKPHGIVVSWTTLRDSEPTRKKHTERVYWCCKGKCDLVLKRKYYREGIIDRWEDISDLIIPIVYIRWVMVMLNELHGGDTYSKEALNNSKELLLNLFPLVSRDMTDAREGSHQEFGDDSSLPRWLGI